MTIATTSETTVAVTPECIRLERPWKESKAGLLKRGAVREGDIIAKEFPRTRFFWHDSDIGRCLRQFRSETNFVTGMSGYSDLGADRCAELNIRVGQYEHAVMGLMMSGVNRMRDKMPRVKLGFVYGSSALGVDLAIQEVAKAENIPLVGITCPDYLWYVDNEPDGPPICIKSDKELYCQTYVETCDLLMASNGGQVSYRKDIIAAFERHIPVLPINVVGMLGASIPAFRPDGSVNDAVGALLHGQRLIGFSQSHGLAQDRFADVADQFADAVTARAREVAPPQYAFDPLPK